MEIKEPIYRELHISCSHSATKPPSRVSKITMLIHVLLYFVEISEIYRERDVSLKGGLIFRTQQLYFALCVCVFWKVHEQRINFLKTSEMGCRPEWHIPIEPT